MGTDNIENNDKYEDLFNLQVLKKNDLVGFNEINSTFTPFDNKVNNNNNSIQECFTMNTKKRDFEQFNDYNEQKTPLKLDIFSGSSRNFFQKTEIEPFFQPVKDMSFVNGMGVVVDKLEDRYTDALRLERRNEKPFEPELIGPSKNNKYNGLHDTTRVLPKLTDELRRSDMPKLSYTAEPIQGKNINKRSVIAPLVKRAPEKFKELTKSDLIPKSQVSTAAIRDNYNLVLNNRALLSKEIYGAPQEQVAKKFDIKTAGTHQESTKNKYNEPNNQNISGLTPIYNLNKKSINLPELERNDYQIDYINLNNQSKVASFNPCDITKPTVRQTLDNLNYTNINTSVNKVQSLNPCDTTKPTVRQTLDNFDYNNIITSANKVQSHNPCDTTKPTVRQTLDNFDYSNIITSTNKVQSHNPCDTTKPTVRQTLNNFDYSNIIVSANKVQSHNPCDTTKPTVRQTLDNFDYSNIIASANKVQSHNPYDTTKPTVRQTLDNFDYSNIIASANKVQSHNPYDTTKPTVRQTLDNFDYSNIIASANKVQSYNPCDIPKPTVKETLPQNEYTNIQIPKNNTIQLLDKAKITNKETINIDVLNKYSNVVLNKKNITSLPDEAKITLKQILENIDYSNIQNNTNKSLANLQDIAKTTQELPHFNNENLSTFKKIKITDIEKLRKTIRELTTTELITAPCGADIATTSQLSDLAKITNKEITLYEETGNLQSMDGSFVNTYETPNITLKQLLDYSDYLSIVNNNNASYAHDPCDIAKITNKQDTISFNYDNHAHNPMHGGYQAEKYDIQSTLKDITKVVDYVNNPNAAYGNILKDNYLSAQLNRVKEEILKNRNPTPIGNLQAPKAENVNIMLKETPNINYIPGPYFNKSSIDDRINMILTSMKNSPYFNDRLDRSLQDQLKTNNIVNNMVHKANN